MSESTGKETPSTGALPKATQNNNKRSSKTKKKYREMDAGTGEIVQAGSESFGEDLSLDDPAITEEIRRKKRNKSVSFALEDEGASKKSKDDPAVRKHVSRIFRNSGMKNPLALSKNHKLIIKKGKSKYEKINTDDVNDERKKDEPNTECNDHPKNCKQPKRSNTASNELTVKRNESNSEDVMTSELENLQIDQNDVTSLLSFDNAPTSQKLKKKNLDRELPEPVQTDINSNVSDDFNLKKVVKWTKKRWNKDKKGASVISNQRTSVIVQDLPKKMSSEYQKQLADVFEKFGRIKRIGPAETQPEKDGEAVFSTTVYFKTEEAATKALDVVSLDGSSIRVSRPLPPSETVAVARSLSPLSVDELRAIFGGDGALRDVHAVQRRNGRMAVAFLTFDGPVAVQHALALSGITKINDKPVYVSKFEVRDKRNQQPENV